MSVETYFDWLADKVKTLTSNKANESLEAVVRLRLKGVGANFRADETNCYVARLGYYPERMGIRQLRKEIVRAKLVELCLEGIEDTWFRAIVAESRQKKLNLLLKELLSDAEAYLTTQRFLRLKPNYSQTSLIKGENSRDKPKKERDSSIKCKSCDLIGHSVNSCWRLHPELKPVVAQRAVSDKKPDGSKKVKSKILFTISNNSLNFNKFNFIIRINNTNIGGSALLDSGCEGKSYISPSIEKVLKRWVDPIKEEELRVKTPNGVINIVTNIYYIDVKLMIDYYSNNSSPFINIMDLEVAVLETGHDLILSLEIGLEYDLFKLLSEKKVYREHSPHLEDEGVESHLNRVFVELPMEDPEGIIHTYENVEIREKEPVSVELPRITTGGTLGKKLEQLCQEFQCLWSKELDASPALVPPMRIERLADVATPQSLRDPPRRLPDTLVAEANRQVGEMLRAGVIEQADVTERSQILLVKKKTGQYRFCIDYRDLNKITKKSQWPIPLIDPMLSRVTNKLFYGLCDMTQGYLQMPLDPESRKLSAFTTPNGVYQFTRVPFGLQNAPSYFQSTMTEVVFKDICYDRVEVYIDDILTHGNSEEEFLCNLRLVFERLKAARLRLNPSKCILGVRTIEFLGRVLSQDGITISEERKLAVASIPRPNSMTRLRSFLGLANYFRQFVKNYSIVVAPLNRLLSGSNSSKTNQTTQVNWDDKALKAFEEIKDAIANCATLYLPNERWEILLATDACDTGVGGFLHQFDGESVRPIAFVSKAFTGTELLWSTTDKEAFATFFAVKNLSYFLILRKFIILTDHKNLLFLKEMTSPKIVRYRIFMSEFQYELRYVKGSDNIVADAFSRLATMCSSGEVDVGRFHNDATGHHGINKTFDMMVDAGVDTKGLRKAITDFISQCALCQKAAEKAETLRGERFTLSSYEPMVKIAIDTMGPLRTDRFGYNFIVVITDRFSRYTELYPTHANNAVETATALLNFTCRWGFPSEITQTKDLNITMIFGNNSVC